MPVLLFVSVVLLAFAIHHELTDSVDRAILLALAAPRDWVPLISATTWLGDTSTRLGVTAVAVLLLVFRRSLPKANFATARISGQQLRPLQSDANLCLDDERAGEARNTRRAVMLVSTIAGGAALASTIKAIVDRPRPALLPHLDHVTSASFPSGHAANGTILYLSLAFLVPPRHRRAALVAAATVSLAIGLSRISLAVHWPTDVIAGWAFGIGWVLLWRRRLVMPGHG